MCIPASTETLAPSLAVAINSEEMERMIGDGSDLGSEINLYHPTSEYFKKYTVGVLERIFRQLCGGVFHCWCTTEGGTWEDPDDDEEHWARMISEMLLCIPYGGPGVSYSVKDKDLFEAMSRHSDKAYPIVAACQHVCTMAGITRGWAFRNGYMDADKAENLKRIIEGAPGSNPLISGFSLLSNFYTDRESRDLVVNGKMNPWYAKAEHTLSPGTIYGFYNGLDENGNRAHGAHTSFVLRVNKDRTRVQFFDTVLGIGAPTPETPTPKIVAGQSYARAYDFGYTDRVKGPFSQKQDGSSYQGVGFVDTMDLRGITDAFRKARPLGLSRLVLTRRSDKEIVYASPLLLMYDTDVDTQNYSIASYLCSLRMFPGRKYIDATWILYIPRDELAKQMIYTYEELQEKSPNQKPSKDPDFGAAMMGRSARQKSLREMLRAVYGTAVHKKTLQLPLLCVAIVSTAPDMVPAVSEQALKRSSDDKPPIPDIWKMKDTHDRGYVRVTGYYHEKQSKSTAKPLQAWQNLPWDKPSGPVRLTKEELESGGAFYFVGSWNEEDGYGPE